MPLSLREKVDLREMRPTTISPELGDRSMKYPMGILEDVPIKVGHLYVPVDFVILEMEEDTRTLVILRRPFLATAGCRIDVKNGKLSFDVGDDHVKLNLFKASKFPSIFDECHMIDVVDGLVWETISNHESNDPLKHCLDANPEIAMCAQFLEASPRVPPTLAKAGTLVMYAKSSSNEERSP